VKLLPKFALLSIGVAALPLAVAGYQSSRISQAALRGALLDNEMMVARQVAEYVASHLRNLHATLTTQTRAIDLTRQGKVTPSEKLMAGFLQLAYHQSDDFSAVAWLDGRTGRVLDSPAFLPILRPNSALGGHEALSTKDVNLLPLLTPMAEVRAEGSGIGPVFLAGSAQHPHILLAVKYDAMPEETPRVMVAAVSLYRIMDYLVNVASAAADRDVLLLDRQSRVVASGREVGPSRLQLKWLPNASAGSLPVGEFHAEYDSGGRKVLGAYSPASPFNLGVLVERRLEVALSPVRRLGWTTVYWMTVSGLVAAAVGAVLARTLSSRVVALADGARQIAQGKLDTQLEVQTNDELGELAKAFNAMATSLDAARNEIFRQTDEIVAWNETLERRVDEKTKELREAQDLLLRSRSLAAIGSLGAGVAHEINNPLTGVLGLSQLLLADLPQDHPARPMVRDIEEQAVRIQAIVSNLLRLAQRQSGEDFRPLDMRQVLDDALELCGVHGQGQGGEATDGAIKVVRNVARGLPAVRGSSVQLQAALMQLIQNAKGAMEGGGQLTVEVTAAEAGLLRLRISDTGRGIKAEHLPRIFDPFFTTKIRRTDTGIGLSVVHKIIEDHGGSIRVDSEPGQGTTFSITFPIDRGASHLA
jgi:two-component system NtrC family sensor kinase